MEFTETQKLNICKVLGISLPTLDSHLNTLPAGYISETVITQVDAELTRWSNGAGSDFVRVEAKERNFGAVIDPSKERSDIKKNIAILLQFDLSDFNFGGFGRRTLRG